MEKDNLTLADHAEKWYAKQGKEIPARDSEKWRVMYIEWHSYAFASFPEKLGEK